jgi:ribosomal protein S18 acetylase RimI-like enzyme
MKAIEYKKNHSNAIDILNHLNNCDDNFIPKLSSKVNLQDYSNKIFDNAVRYEAWFNNDLIGLVAVYQNIIKQEMFITNVSIENKYTGNGIANQLMNQLLILFNSQDFNKIKLEVEVNNKIAINLYTKYNFKLESQNANSLTLELNKNE